MSRVVFGDVQEAEIIEAVIKQGHRIQELRGIVLFHNDTDEPHSAPVASCHQSLAGLGGVACFPAEDTVIGINLADQRVLVCQPEVVRLRRRRLEVISARIADDLADLIGKKRLPYKTEVIGAGVMIVVIKAVRVGKVRINAAKRRSLFIHQIGEGLHGPCGFFRKRVGALVRGTDQRRVQALLHRNCLADIHSSIGAVRGNGFHSRLGKGDRVVQIEIFRRDQRRQELGRAGGIHSVVDVFGVQKNSRVGVHEDRASGSDGRPLRPAVDQVGLDFQLQICLRGSGIDDMTVGGIHVAGFCIKRNGRPYRDSRADHKDRY